MHLPFFLQSIDVYVKAFLPPIPCSYCSTRGFRGALRCAPSRLSRSSQQSPDTSLGFQHLWWVGWLHLHLQRNRPGIVSPPSMQYVAAYGAALTVVYLLGGLSAWVLARTLRGFPFNPSCWQSRVLCVCGSLACGLLYIPLLFLVLSGFNCGDAVSRTEGGIAC
jgi:hypothetical protein